MRPPIRPRAALSLLLAVALELAALPAAHAAGAQDRDRNRAEPLAEAQHRAWRAIGRVNVAGFDTGGFCTGTLIAPDRVLTAAHCLYALRGSARAQPGQVHFLAGWYKGTYAAHRIARAVLSNPDFHPGKKPDFRSLRSDVALLVLETPITDIPPLPVATPDLVGPSVTVIGYRRDRLNALTKVTDCRVVVQNPGMVGLGCPVVQGTSGAPVLQREGSRWSVVGVVSASVSGAGEIHSVAARPSAAFLAGR
ncbi:trypsin-like serine peptidase [Rhodovulum visakhapatnamense]|uniref:Trypsin-like peptidase domain-containing protein n=1 Tax=Rhodovulum visakhapatnamense TaxID=364297 RepID=A0ABS1RH08_9RHOB|nr:serine protease [Rhodovulum visakhapatnamense]MBL3571739.1 trypsin-like peptidase domain-containing protein [Rhodovulum visakhapatnamense]MBL3578809.1 trypsin-like peptidase domain-containing protein [Rhodovulum visakhapatnamense]